MAAAAGGPEEVGDKSYVLPVRVMIQALSTEYAQPVVAEDQARDRIEFLAVDA